MGSRRASHQSTIRPRLNAAEDGLAGVIRAPLSAEPSPALRPHPCRARPPMETRHVAGRPSRPPRPSTRASSGRVMAVVHPRLRPEAIPSLPIPRGTQYGVPMEPRPFRPRTTVECPFRTRGQRSRSCRFRTVSTALGQALGLGWHVEPQPTHDVTIPVACGTLPSPGPRSPHRACTGWPSGTSRPELEAQSPCAADARRTPDWRPLRRRSDGIRWALGNDAHSWRSPCRPADGGPPHCSFHRSRSVSATDRDVVLEPPSPRGCSQRDKMGNTGAPVGWIRHPASQGGGSAVT